MRFSVLILAASLALSSCNWIGDKTKKAINKTGEVVGEGASEFGKGVASGVENTFDSEVSVADVLKQKGVSIGKFSIGTENSSNKNKLTVYLVFSNDFNGNVSAKIFDKSGKEYGRTSVIVTAKKGEAKYADFVFDPRTDVESKSKFVLE